MSELLPQQLSAIDKLRRYKVGALFMRPGTGKTRIAMELIRSVDDTDLALWLGPYNSIHRRDNAGIKAEIAKWGGLHRPVTFMGIESLSQSTRMYLDLMDQLEQAHNPFIVVDESLKIKNARAKRTSRITQLGELCKYKLILNGTPISRNLLDLWAQMQFLSPRILNMSLAQFKHTFCETVRIEKRIGNRTVFVREFISRYHNVDYLYSLLHHYVFVADLNMAIHQHHFDIDYEVDQVSKEEYETIKKKYLDLEKLEFMRNNIFLAMTQEMQHAYCCTPQKFEVLHALFKSIPQEETIIACKFIRSQEACRQAFPKATVLSLQKDSHSLNLQHCNNLIFFDKTWDWALVDQMMHRIWRTGQQHDCRFYRLHGNVKLDGLMQRNNDTKEDMLKYLKVATLKEIL